MVTSGDVLLRFARELPVFPEVDMLGLGMWLAPERACHFGVFCAPRGHPSELAFFLQKPPAAKIRQLAENYLCLVDTGMWLLSARAVRVLMERSGWDASKSQFPCRHAVPLTKCTRTSASPWEKRPRRETTLSMP